MTAFSTTGQRALQFMTSFWHGAVAAWHRRLVRSGNFENRLSLSRFVACSAALVLSLSWVCCVVAAPEKPENPLTPAEDGFFKEAMEAFEKGDHQTADASLARVRALIGTRSVPWEISSSLLDLGFQISVKLADAAIADSKQLNGLANPEFEKAWALVEQRTNELIPFQEEIIAGTLERKNESGLVYGAARLQRVHMDRAGLLQRAHAFKEALAEVAVAAELFEKYKEYAGKEIGIQIRSPKGVETVRRPRGEAAGLLTPEATLQERIAILRSWRLALTEDVEAVALLGTAYGDFVTNYPSHPRAYHFLRDSMNLDGNLDLKRLQKVLEATANKDTAQYVGNQISFANLLGSAKRYDEALELYETALKSEKCPPGRVAEIYVQMADIHAAAGRTERAKECYAIAKGMSDKFKHIDSAMAALEKKKPEKIDGTGGNRPQSSRAMLIVGLNVAVIAVAIGFFLLRHHHSKRKDVS